MNQIENLDIPLRGCEPGVQVGADKKNVSQSGKHTNKKVQK